MNLLNTIACLLALSATVKANELLGGPVYAPGHASLDYYAYPTYAFEYAVRDPHTGDNKAQWEKRDGDVVVGAYSLVEPDGSIRVVEYKADDKSGFNAVVKRIGPNLHPVAPIYKAPLPILGEKLISPLSIGPVAGLKGLSSAPLLTGQLLGKGSNIYGGKLPSLLKELGPIAPITSILPAPISYAPNIIKEPIIAQPLPYGPQLIKEPIIYNPNPIKGPIISGISPYGSIPIKEPILPSLLPYGPNLIKGPILSGPYGPNLIKESILSGSLNYGPNLIKEPILSGPLNYGPNLIKEPILSGSLPYGPLPLLNKEPYLQGPLLNPSYPILKGPLEIPNLGKWSSGLDESLGKGLWNRPNNGWH